MAACSWSVNEDAPGRVEFICATCSRMIGFVKAGHGSPNPVPDGSGGWTPPENVLDWLDPCP